MNLPAAALATPLIAAKNLTITYGGTPILDSVDLAIRPGEIVTLIGPNGSGKTTLVRALLGLVPAASGRIVRNTSRIGYVPQSFARDRSLPLTGLRFLTSFGAGSENDARDALAKTGVTHAADRQLSSLSGGEMARVALARALLKRPELLVLDEPLAGVDIAGEAALYELIARMRTELGAAILLVSHDLHIVMAAADHVVCLNRHVCCEGDAAAVVRDPAFIALFGPQVADQIALYTHRHDHAHSASGAILHAEPHNHDHQGRGHHDHDHHGHDHHG
ncbi:MAG TPA: metal ABC transporter ATP-binding protein [Micropepsaceae bacterium]|nr:metal ABC transporter ATP-binding protein [Micropepsaceae bacterium]